MQPMANVFNYRGLDFQNATEFGKKSIIIQVFRPPPRAFGRFLQFYERNLKDKIATLQCQRTQHEKTRPPDIYPIVPPPPRGPERRHPLAELQHRRRAPRQLRPLHLPGQRRTIMVMHARGHLHVRRTALQAARGSVLLPAGRSRHEPGGRPAAPALVHHHPRHRLLRPRDRGNPHRPRQYVRRPDRRGRHRRGPQRHGLVRQRGHLLLGSFPGSAGGLLPHRPVPQQHGRGRQQRQRLVPDHQRRPAPFQPNHQQFRTDPPRLGRTLLPAGPRIGRKGPYALLRAGRGRPQHRYLHQCHDGLLPDRHQRNPLHHP